MPECQLVHESERRTTKDRNLAAGLQPATSAQFTGLLVTRRVCTNAGGDAGMRKASTRLLEQGIQAPSPTSSPLKHQPRTYIGIGTSDGGTSCDHRNNKLRGSCRKGHPIAAV